MLSPLQCDKGMNAIRRKLPPWVTGLGVIAVLALIVLLVIKATSTANDSPPQTTPGPHGSQPTLETPTPTPTRPLDATIAALVSPSPTPVGTIIPMVRIEQATFAMGDDPKNAWQACNQSGMKCEFNWFSDAQPIHTVKISSFYIDQFEVTNAQYDECVQSGFCSSPASVSSATRTEYYTDPQFANYPVIYVNWQQAQEYCDWRGGRLPTEAEWEVAARGGLEGKAYPWGNDLPTCKDRAGNGARFAGTGCENADTAPVGSYMPNGLHLFDITGNVMEWVGDWYNEFYYASLMAEALNPSGALSGSQRVVRGGGWDSPAYMLRVAMRYRFDPEAGAPDIGFRCVLQR